MPNFFSKENITFIFSVIGAFYAAASVLMSVIKARQRFKVFVPYARQGDKKDIVIYLSIENLSSKNLSVYAFTLVNKDKHLNATTIPENVFTFTKRVGKEEVFRREDFSLGFPFIVYPHSVVSGYAYFPNPEGIDIDLEKPVILQIQTNKKKEFRMTLPYFQKR